MSAMTLTPACEAALRAHALAEFPNESCGLIVDGDYVPCVNQAASPKVDFKIAGQDLVKYSGRIQAVVHSHPTNEAAPSMNDMKAQISSGFPFIIVPTNGERSGKLAIWGDSLPIQPLIGREFMHGVSDCYTAIRDTFRVGATEAKAQGMVAWPYEPIVLPEFPRDDGWWGGQGKPGLDLYVDGFAKAGFKQISNEEIKPGDVFLCKIRSEQLNHGGLLISSDLLFHHLPGRLSRREPAGMWARAADIWLRYVGIPNAA